jgi:hypothetical protein|tara:strand:+ start:3433 stop:3984 length:552 start_codon:yes stop_codon:yes gene_type:complete
MKIKDIIERGLIMPQTIKPMGLIHLPGTGPNNRFDFKNKGNNRANEARGSCWHGYQQKGYKKKGNKMVPNCVKEQSSNEEAAGVGIITKQNTTQDVKPGETTRQANKLHLGLTKKGLPARGMRENFADKKVKGKSRPGRVKRSGASCKGSVSSLRAKAKKYGGERGKMYHWCANMKSGRKKKK